MYHREGISLRKETLSFSFSRNFVTRSLDSRQKRSRRPSCGLIAKFFTSSSDADESAAIDEQTNAVWEMSILNASREFPRDDKTLIYYRGRRRVNSAAQQRALICKPLSVRRLLINYFPGDLPVLPSAGAKSAKYRE